MLSIVFDIAILVVIAACTIMYLNKGFISGIINFAGVFIALLGAFLLAKYASVSIFDSFFRERFIQRATETIRINTAISLEELIHALIAFIPIGLINIISEGASAQIGSIQENLAATIVDKAIGPIVIPIIAFVLFMVAFFLLKFIVKSIAKLFQGLNNVPLVGGINKFLGCITGILIGFVYAFVIICVIWTFDATGQFTLIPKYFNSSYVLRAMETFNFYR